ncbi:MAG TPA: non-homologous end-joining DNA ligase [Dehalococcoidia bacterium]|nr:non-homologous end-joining DNA ligase [Dehalococcoidia bacterium]
MPARESTARAPTDRALQRYREKRDFTRTPEPPPGSADDAAKNLVFVVQQHAATRMHWDFRLEVDGVLKSWPLPKGPSLNPRDRRMAVMVEDHPYEYRNFEGVIPRGEYGAGQVIIWDEGTYTPDEGGVYSWDNKEEGNRRMREGLEKGKLSFTLRGHKLKGSFTLVKTRYDKNSWLLIKHQDEYATTGDILEEDRSVRSGLRIEDLKEGRLPGGGRGAEPHPAAKKTPFPDSRKERPMMATLVDRVFDRPGWLWEPKLDGIRALAFIRDGKVELRSRRGLDCTRQYPALAADLARQQGQPLVLDGEICALDEAGVPRFQLLQPRINLTREHDIARMEAELPVVYFVFDILYAEGWDLHGVPLRDRKALLGRYVAQGPRIKLVSYVADDGPAMEAASRELGFEGVVGKRADSRYEPGVRSKSWVKVKSVNEQEFVVGGYTPGEGSRSKSFGSIAVGYWDDGKLIHVANVGSGFTDATLASTLKQLRDLETDEKPFANRVEGKVVWVRPELVAQVKFQEWTADNHLRAPVFLGLRPDVDPRQVRKEAPAPAAAAIEVVEEPAGRSEDGLEEEVRGVLAQIDAAAKRDVVVEVQGERVKLTNLDKEFWPAYRGSAATGTEGIEHPPLTKGDMIRYYVKVAPWLLRHLKDRPLTLTRYPNGITGSLFYQKHYSQPIPPFVETVDIWSEHNQENGTYLMCNNLPTLIWLAQIADLEIHAWMSRIDPEPDAHGRKLAARGSKQEARESILNFPDYMVFDLDPYIYSGAEKKGAEPEFNRRAWEKTVSVALDLKALLDQLKLSSFVKTTGKTGLHVYVPIRRDFTYDEVREFTRTLGVYLVQQRPADITMEWDTTKRRGKVFYDYNQNTFGKQLAAQYSLRPTPWAGVSMPVLWSELPKADPLAFRIDSVPDRLARSGDPWRDILDFKNDVSRLLAG